MDNLRNLFQRFFNDGSTARRRAFYSLVCCVLLSVIAVFTVRNSLLLESIAGEYEKSTAFSAEQVFIASSTQQASVENSEKETDSVLSSEPSDESEALTKQESLPAHKAEKITAEQKETSVAKAEKPASPAEKTDYVINKNSKKIHLKDCSFVGRMKEENRQYESLNQAELEEYLQNGYTLCAVCGG